MVWNEDELVEIVDREDRVLYVTTREEADRKHLRMRTARAIVFDPDMKVWIHRRALKKPVDNGLYDVGIGETPRVTLVNGKCMSESYDEAVKRGLSEELFCGRVSIGDLVVDHIARLPPIDIPRSPRNYDVFAFYYDPGCHGPMTPEEDEIEYGSDRFLRAPELQELLLGKEALMGIAPVIGQLALYIIKNPSVIKNPAAIPINLKGAYKE